MFFHIMKREILDHLMSLRFALSLGAITALLVLGTLIFVSGDHKRKLAEYSLNNAWVNDQIRESCRQLNELATRGPIALYKRPSALAFCATDQEDALPMRIAAEIPSNMWVSHGNSFYRYSIPWRLQYVPDSYQEDSMLPRVGALDWGYIIGLVTSFVAILLTFDAISGERENGTLALVLSNTVSRAGVLAGKFLGAFIVLAIPMLIGILLSALIVSLSGIVSLHGADWARIGLMVVLSFIYISLFVGLGLTVSGHVRHSSTSLVVLLLIWIVLVVLIPNTFGTVVSTLHTVPSKREFQEKRIAALASETKSYDVLFKHGSPTDPNPDRRALQLWADYITTPWNIETRLDDEHLDAQFTQVQFARQILRLSPAVIYNYGMESLAGTGFAGHHEFVKAARRYRQQFIEFIKETDSADPGSPHIFYLKEGLSDKPVPFSGVPRFEEFTNNSMITGETLRDFGLLILFCAVISLASFLAFLKSEVR